MTETARNQGLLPPLPGGTAASSHHLPDSLDWSSLSSRIKNRTVLIPVKMKTMQNLKAPETKITDIPRPNK